MAATPAMTPPAIAPTLAADLDECEGFGSVDGADDAGTQTVCWQALHVGGINEQTSSDLHVGHGGVSLLHLRQSLWKSAGNDAGKMD